MKQDSPPPVSTLRPAPLALGVALAYIVLSGCYVVWSGHVAERWAAGSAHQLARYEEVKGLWFIALSGFAFFLAAFAFLKRIAAHEGRMRQNELALVAVDRQAMAGLFAGTVAHDIGNMLTVATTALERLEDPTSPDSDRRNALVEVTRTLDDLSRLSRKLLLVQGARAPARIENGPLAPVMRETVRFAQSHPRVRGCLISLSLDDVVRAPHNATTVGRILLNLILNAADATGGRGRIDVRLWRSEGLAHLEVHDNGLGIALNMREKIFEPLYTSKADGTGLGLLSVKAGAEELGGSVSVIDSPFGGACFRVTIPSSS
jgi:two-component system sensor histidine kinase HydH